MTDWIEISALFGGPILAVSLTLWREKNRQERERKLEVMRKLLVARSDASDPAFSISMNLVPIEFGHCESVMTAWEEFTHSAQQGSASDAQVSRLVKEMMLNLRYSDRAASQVAREAYSAKGFTDQKKLWAGVLKGVLGIAKASRISAQASTAMVEHITGKPLPALPDE